jgi:hypothetical protein
MDIWEDYLLDKETLKPVIFHVVGKITCDEKPVKVAYLLKDSYWGQFFTLDPNLSQGHLLNSINTSSLSVSKNTSNPCFIGDIKAAEQAISNHLGIPGKIAGNDSIEYTFKTTPCVEHAGSIDQDDWVCTKWGEAYPTASIHACINR